MRSYLNKRVQNMRCIYFLRYNLFTVYSVHKTHDNCIISNCFFDTVNSPGKAPYFRETIKRSTPLASLESTLLDDTLFINQTSIFLKTFFSLSSAITPSLISLRFESPQIIYEPTAPAPELLLILSACLSPHKFL